MSAARDGSADPGGEPPHGEPLLGRDREQSLLAAELGAALAGAGRVATVVGEPGIGKTRLAAELAAEARRRGAAVAWGRCHEDEGGPVYWPVLQLLGQLLPLLRGEVAARLAAALALLRAGDAAP